MLASPKGTVISYVDGGGGGGGCTTVGGNRSGLAPTKKKKKKGGGGGVIQPCMLKPGTKCFRVVLMHKLLL